MKLELLSYLNRQTVQNNLRSGLDDQRNHGIRAVVTTVALLDTCRGTVMHHAAEVMQERIRVKNRQMSQNLKKRVLKTLVLNKVFSSIAWNSGSQSR